MDALFLPGASPINRPWIHALADNLGDLFATSVVCEYQSWDNPKTGPDENTELARIAAAIKKLKSPYVVTAKSIGTYLGLKLIKQEILQPNSCIFLGIPLGLMNRAADTQTLLGANQSPTLVLQNSQDPVGSFAEVEAYFTQLSMGNYQLTELPGNTHEYAQFDVMRPLVQSFIRNTPRRRIKHRAIQ